jgi:hypothetical protein
VHDHQALRTYAKATRVTKRATTPFRAVDTCGRGWTAVPRPGRTEPGRQTRVPVNPQPGLGGHGQVARHFGLGVGRAEVGELG